MSIKTKTNDRIKKRGKLSREIVGILALSFIVATIAFRVLLTVVRMVAESIVVDQGRILTEAQIAGLGAWLYKISFLISACIFIIIFLFVLEKRLSYIKEILKGIEILHSGNGVHEVPLMGNDELTVLAEAVNYLSQTQQQIRHGEHEMNEEKELLIRSLFHDIRTPLTSITAYSEYLAANDNCEKQKHREYLNIIVKKADQIRALTDTMLERSNRNPEKIDNAGLLMMQLAAEFEEALDDCFIVLKDTSQCLSTAGVFDILEMRRIFDNLISNIKKYADFDRPVELQISVNNERVQIIQRNGIRAEKEASESYQIGIKSIKRIVNNYAGHMNIRKENGCFEIVIELVDI